MRALYDALRTSPRGVFAVSVLVTALFSAVLSFIWLPNPPLHSFTDQLWSPPSGKFLLGTDGSGRDIFARLLLGSRVTIIVAIAVGVCSAVFGVSIALLAAIGPKWVREPVRVVIDLAFSFPTLLFALTLAAVFHAGLFITVISLSAGFSMGLARVLRAELAQLSNTDYVLAARATGLPRFTILRRHILSGVKPVFIVQITLVMGLAILAESSLSYLGFGATQENPSWGLMLAETQHSITVYPLAALWPGLAITLLVYACYALGDILRVALDPLTTQGAKEAKSA